MGRIRNHRNLDVALRLAIQALNANTQMVFHVAASLVLRLQRAELWQNCWQRLPTNVRQYVQATTMRHSDYHRIDAQRWWAINHLRDKKYNKIVL